MSDAQERVRRQFAGNAADYRDAAIFAAGEDLGLMREAAQPQGGERLLDVGAGAGHVALAFASAVQSCVGVDLTDAMVDVATALAKERGAQNVTFQTADAERLPFADQAFDLVTCRFALHHFAQAPRALGEMSRVLRPGGRLLLVDHWAPDDAQLDAFINRLDRLRDPSHVREHRLPQLRAMFARSGLECEQRAIWDLPLAVDDWLQRARADAPTRVQVASLLAEAHPRCAQAFSLVRDPSGRVIEFSLKCALLLGVKQ